MNFISKVSQQLTDWFCVESQSAGADSMPELQSLEERVLYSASPVPIELFTDASQVEVDLEQLEQRFDLLSDAFEQLQIEETSHEARLQLDVDEFLPELAGFGDEPSQVSEQLELVVIDSGVEGFEALRENVLQSYESDQVRVHQIDSRVDGVSEITRLLEQAGRQGVSFSAVHIVSHGDAGEIQLGNVTLDGETLVRYTSEIASWSHGLSENADILIYGCDLTSNSDGEFLAESISILSGADVAASNDITGHSIVGGDWELEYEFGSVESNVVFTASLTDSWEYSLATTLGDAAGTAHKSIAADFAGNQTIVSSTDDSGSWIVQVSRYSNFDPTDPLEQFNGADFENVQVNSDVDPGSGNHQHAVVGSASNGNFVVAWEWESDDQTESRIYAKVYDALGNVIKDQFQVDDGDNGNNVTVAMNQSGEFVVGWQRPHDSDHNHMLVRTFDANGDLVNGSYDEHIEVGYENVVVSINDLGHVAMAYSIADDQFGARVISAAGNLSDEFTFTSSSASGFDELAIDINNDGIVGVAFVAKVGPFGSDNKDVYSVLLEYDNSNDSLVNISPTTEISVGVGAISIDAVNHSGKDAGLEYAPSIVLKDGVPSGGNTETVYHVTWHGQGSWKSNFDNGTVVDSGVPVTNESAFPTGSLDADNGVFMSTTSYLSDGTVTESPEESLQNELSDFNTNSKNTSVTAFRDRTAIAVVFEDASGQVAATADVFNEPPVASSSAAFGLENFSIQFQSANFGYSDAESQPLHSIRIETLPSVGELTLFGNPITQTAIDANGGFVVANSSISSLQWVPPVDVFGLNLTDFQFRVSDGESWSTAAATMQLTVDAEDRLWVSTLGDSSGATGIPGNGTGVLQFGGPTVSFGETTNGFWSEQFSRSGIEIDALHIVDNSISIGASSTTTLNAGDVLFSTKFVASGMSIGPVRIGLEVTVPGVSGGVSIGSGDIVRFRPTSADYSTGEFEIVASLDQMYASTPDEYDLNALALVEQDTIVGGKIINAGSFIFADTEQSNVVRLLELDTVGDSSTGTMSTLIDGSEVGISNAISALELIEARTSAGGVVLNAGSVLASIDTAETVGSSEELAVESHDIFVLDVESITSTTPAVAAASIFLDGSDVGGSSAEPDSAIDAVTLLGNPDASASIVAEPESLNLDENEVHRFKAEDFVSDATAGALASVVITSLPDSAYGDLVFKGEAVSVGQTIEVADLGFLIYQPKLEVSTTSDSFSYRAASDSEVLPERSISIQIAAVPDDLLTGGGTELYNVQSSDVAVVTPDGWNRTESQVTALTDGGYVVAWRLESGTESAIQMQRYDADHQKVGGLIDFTDGNPTEPRSMPRVAGLSDGGFVAIATRDVDNGEGEHVYVTRYDSASEKVLLESTVDGVRGNKISATGGQQQAGDVVGLQDGGFAMSYVDDSSGQSRIRGLVFYDGAFINEFDMSSSLPGIEYANVSMAPTKQGGFVAVWNATSAFAGTSIDAQYFDANGFPVGPRISLGSTRNVDSTPSVSVLSNNQAIVVWGETSTGDPLGDFKVVGSVINNDGTIASSGEVTIAHDEVSLAPDVVALKDGGFLVAVEDTDIDGSQQSIAAHRFDSQFSQIGSAEAINVEQTGTQSAPQITLLQDGSQIVGVWNTDALGTANDVVSNAVMFESSAARGSRILLNLTNEVLPGASDTINNVEISGLESGVRMFADETASGNNVELFGPSFNLNSYDLDSVELLLPDGVTETNYQVSTTLDDGVAPKTLTQMLVATTFDTGTTISGTVFNDENADGLVHDASGFDGVTVKLYEDVAGVRTEIASATTNGSGYYEFTGIFAGTYFVVVDSTTIGSDVVGDAGDASDLGRIWAEQTYGGDGSVGATLDGTTNFAGFMFGGRRADVSDDASTLAGSEHVNRQTIIATSDVHANVDFGFSFNVVTNVEDAYDPGNPDARTVQGSLRQFMENANFVDGRNEMKFVPAVGPNNSSDSDNDLSTGDSWWSINLVALLPEIYVSETIVDGQAWVADAGGLMELDYNAFTVRNSFTGTVGTRGTAFEETDAPELELLGNDTLDHGFRVKANSTYTIVNDVEINNFSIHGFGQDGTGAQIKVYKSGATDLSNLLIQNNVIGSGPNDLATDVTALTGSVMGITMYGSGGGLISNNIIIGQTASGISIAPQAADSLWTIVDNEIAANSSLSSRQDGINSIGVRNLTILRNAIHGNYGMGIDNYSTQAGSGQWTIEDNSVFDNGRDDDPEGSGIRLTGNDSVVRYNSIYDNLYDGVSVTGYVDQSSGVFVPASGNLISQNSFENNGQIAIDLKRDLFDGLIFDDYDTNSDGVIEFDESFGSVRDSFAYLGTLISVDGGISEAEADYYFDRSVGLGDSFNPRDGVANTDTANDGIDRPVINSAEFDFGDLNLEFEIQNSNTDRLELYTTLPGDTSSDSEAWEYFKTISVASMTDEGGGIYSITIPASDFPGGTPRDTSIRALAIDTNNNTSEFGNSETPITVNHAPVVSDTNTQTNEEQTLTFSMGDFGGSDPDSDPITELVITALPDGAEGQLLLNGTAVNANDRIPVGSVGNLTFEPVEDFYGIAVFSFAVSDGSLDSSPATMSIEVLNISDAPIGQDLTHVINEDESFSFDSASFGFSDLKDKDLDAFAGVRIMAFSGGALTLNSATVVAGQIIDASEIGQLEFQPPSNANGNGIATIDFRVIDAGSTNNEDTSTNTLTFDVVPVPDAPTGVSSSNTFNEDIAVIFDSASFGFQDAADGGADSFAGVRIVSFTGTGTLTTNAGNVSDGQFISPSELSELRYYAGDNVYGNDIATIRFQVFDTGSTNNIDLSPNELVIHMLPVSDAPTGQSMTVSIVEDEIVSYSSASFGFSDAIDNDTDSFAGVRIVAFNGSGNLTLDSVDVVAGQFIDAADIGRLRFQPGAGASGAGISSIDFQVVDSGSTNNEDTTVRTLTYDVSPVSDEPTGQSQTINVLEDEIATFDATTFGFSDASDSNADSFAGVRIVSFGGSGSLTLDGTDVAPNTFIDVVDLPRLQFQSDPDQHGVGYATIQFRVMDTGATNNEDTITRTLTIDVDSVSDAPEGVSQTVAINEDEIVSFTSSSFGFADNADSDSFSGVRIVSFSGSGRLTIDNVDVAFDTVISAADLPRLQYQPASNENGTAISQIEFRVIDSGTANNEDTTTRTLTYDVTPVSDAPTGQSARVSIDEDQSLTFSSTTFGFSDSDDSVADNFAGVRIVSFSGAGTLQLAGSDVTSGQFINAADLSNLIYQPAANANGNDLASIDFRVVDSAATNNEDLTDRTLSIDVNALNDAPEGRTDTITINEEEVLTFSESTFGFVDPNDAPADGFGGVRIVGFTGVGTLSIDGVDVLPGAVIDVADLNRLQYFAGTDVTGVGIASIEFRVIDNGGNGSGDENEDATTRALTINVSNLNDAPEGVSQTISIDEDSVYDFTSSIFGFSDAADDSPNVLQGVRIVAVNGGGSLTLDGLSVAAGTVVDAADVSRLRFTPGANQYGTGVCSIEFRVIDDGMTGVGHANEDVTVRSITFDVNAVNDRPESQDFSILMDEESVQPLVSSQFILSDVADAPSEDALMAIRIIDWTGPGRLLFDGVEISRDTIVNAADIGRVSVESDSVVSDTTGEIKFSVIDDGGRNNGGEPESEVRTISFTVRQVNKVPVISSAEFVNAENVNSSHFIPVTDEEGHNYSLAFDGSGNDNSLFEISPDGRSIRFLTAPDFESPQSVSGGNEYVVELIATDSEGGVSDTQLVRVDVQNDAEGIDLNDDVLVNDGSGVSDVSLFANDNGSSTMPNDVSVSVVSQPTSGSVVINPDGTFVFTPATGALAATVEFTYQVERGGEVTTADVIFEQATLPVQQDGGEPNENNPTDPEDNEDPADDADSGDSGNPTDAAGPLTNSDLDDPGIQRFTPRRFAASNSFGANTLSNEISDVEIQAEFTTSNSDSEYSSYTYGTFVDTGLLTTDLISRVIASGRAGLQEFTEDFALAALFWEEMDSANHDYVEASIGEIETVIAVGAFGASVAVGIAMRWALLGISLTATYTQPLWVTTFDFLPVVNSDDDESIQQIVDDRS